MNGQFFKHAPARHARAYIGWLTPLIHDHTQPHKYPSILVKSVQIKAVSTQELVPLALAFVVLVRINHLDLLGTTVALKMIPHYKSI